jgi:hypothetical protein
MSYEFRNPECPSDGDIKYEGEWKNNLKDGRGIWTDDEDNKYEGDWKAGLRHGFGV